MASSRIRSSDADDSVDADHGFDPRRGDEGDEEGLLMGELGRESVSVKSDADEEGRDRNRPLHPSAASGIGRARDRRRRRALLMAAGTATLVAIIIAVGVALSRHKGGVGDAGDTVASFPWSTIRLPKNIVPKQYDLVLFPDLDDLVFSGNVNITVEVRIPTRHVVMHSLGLNVTSVVVSGGASSSLAIERTFSELSNQFLVISMRDALSTGTFVVRIAFAAPLTEELAGLYLSTYTDHATNTTRRIAATQFEPTDARRAFPCFDEPGFKAVFRVAAVIREGFHAISNMPDVQKVALPGKPECIGCAHVPTAAEGTRDLQDARASGEGVFYEVRFSDSVPMSTYLVALVVCDFDHVVPAENSTPTPVRVWGPRGRAHQLVLAANITGRIIASYERTFGVKYALPKLDLVAIPDFAAGAMENWGLITYRESALMYSPEESSSADEQWVCLVVAHELSHQWFGNLVTMEFWDDLWLNEGFAARMEYLGVDAVFPEWRMDDMFLPLTLQRALKTDATNASHPIHVKVENPSEINEIFDDISYEKGASVLRMLASTLGSDTFYGGIRSYVRDHSYGNAETDNLWDALTAATNGTVDVRAFMDTWVRQKGYPLVTVSRHNTTFVRIAQSPFSIGGMASSGLPQTRWAVPLTYATDAGTVDAVTILHGQDILVPIPMDCRWFKLNVGHTGFYRVNYDPMERGCGGWSALAVAFAASTSAVPSPSLALASSDSNGPHNAFLTTDRAGLLDDAFELARAGVVPQRIALELTRYLGDETEYVPWRTALTELSRVGALMQWGDTYAEFVRHVRGIVGAAMDRVGWDTPASHTQRLLQSALAAAAVSHGYRPAMLRATALFRDLLDGNGAYISPDLRDAVYVAGVATGGLDEWEFVWSLYAATDVPSERMRCLRALASTRLPWLLNRLLSDCLDPSRIRTQDAFIVVGLVAASGIGQQLAWDFVRSRWDFLIENYGEGMAIPRIISYVCDGFATPMRLAEFETFFGPRDLRAGRRAVASSREKIGENIEWLRLYQKDVLSWLAEGR